ncbi:MAG: hypothetical protein QOD42_3246 [Sphingomonadales bacterium]|jgi:hypothetical protein|nr:hypothetical protein [Sphingomonadales bacterium]
MPAAALIGLLAAMLAAQPAPQASAGGEAVPFDADAQCLAAIMGNYEVMSGISDPAVDLDRFLASEARVIAYYAGMLRARYPDPARMEREIEAGFASFRAHDPDFRLQRRQQCHERALAELDPLQDRFPFSRQQALIGDRAMGRR